MRFVIFILVFAVSVVHCKNYVKALTESRGQEVIELGTPIKELPPGLDEEPSAEMDEEDKTMSSPPATKRETKKTTTITTTTTELPSATTQQQASREPAEGLSAEDEERRVEKELSDIYKDTDYKAESTNLTTTDGVSQAAPALRQRGRANFKFQPDINDRADVERFRTSVDDISCDKRVTQRLQEMVSIVVLEPGQKSKNQQALAKSGGAGGAGGGGGGGDGGGGAIRLFRNTIAMCSAFLITLACH